MAHELHRVLHKIVNAPQLATQETFDVVLDYIENRNAGQLRYDDDNEYSEELQYNPDTKVGVITVMGPLSYRPVRTMCSPDTPSYMQMEEDYAELVRLGAKTVVFEMDSGGGEAFGCFHAASFMRTLADENGVKNIAFVDGLCASACYGLAAAMHEIVLTPDSELGSIGVLVALLDTSKAMEKAGFKRIFVTAGASKVPFAADGTFKQEFLDDLQDKVDVLYSQFTNHVASYRKLDVSKVIDTEAKVFMAEKAVELGLADKIMTRYEFADYLADLSLQRGSSNMLSKLLGIKQEEVIEMADQAVLADLEGKVVELTTLLGQAEETNRLLQASVAEKEAQFAELSNKLAEMQAEKEQAEQAQANAKEQARKKAVADVVGEAEAEATYEDMRTLSDEAFGRMLTKLAGATKAQAQAPEFLEAGVSGEAQADTNLTATILSQKFQQTTK